MELFDQCAYTSPLFLRVFLGEISEDVMKEQGRLMKDTERLFGLLDLIYADKNGKLSKKIIRTALRAFFEKTGKTKAKGDWGRILNPKP